MDRATFSFDVVQARQSALRQREDADIIVGLADALTAAMKENTDLRAKLAALSPTPTEGKPQ